MKDNKVTIVVPVYADWRSLKVCIKSLKKHVDEKHKVILINDCGPKPELMRKRIKKAIKGLDNFEYYRNAKNLGFVKTCNRAVLELDKTDNDVLLLNSDTEVTEGFLGEMQFILKARSKVGTVSPRSNNATITTIPLSEAVNKGINPDKAYEIWLGIKDLLPRYNEVPVTHGFCMLIRRSLIQKYGLFDEVFGRGYGEENDFCLRIRKRGYKSVLANHAFVFHLEARSFTLPQKAKLLEQNNKIIYKRYPTYRQSVRNYMKKALVREAEAEKAAGIKVRASVKSRLKNLLRKNKKVHRAAAKVHSKVHR
ncbi:MAG TPA: glycosyltransferase family 2 protein [Candidatus Saccharimonadales bacterium]|nr:glycosyltransferase family 2 protein [Candidatus Saccharimonadales bacterium]